MGVGGIKTVRLVVAHTDFAAFNINLMIQGRQMLELVDYVAQCKPGDKKAQIQGCWEFLQVGEGLIDKKYGGSLAITCEVVSGTKTESSIGTGADRQAREDVQRSGVGNR